MAREEKKKRKGYSRRRQPKSSSSLPTDLTAEILSWLPEKSVARFSCVSKLWSSITTDPYFINLFQTRSRSCLLLCVRKDDNLFVSSIPQNTKNSNQFCSSSQPIHRYHINMKLSRSTAYSYRMKSVNGLVCFADARQPFVWNPSTGQLFTLPIPDMNNKQMNVFFGYDPIEGNHKVMCLPIRKTCYVCRVFTLGSGQESWRNVRVNYRHSCGYTRGQCINGVIYYLVSCRGYELVLMSFDVRSERFQMIQVPSDIAHDLLIIYKGRLACADSRNDTRLWILEDAEKHKWSSKDFLSPFGDRHLRIGTGSFRLKGYTDAGEFIYVPKTFHKSFYILFYDPVRNSSRRFQFEGIFDDQYVSENGGCVVSFDACPNHIASQMSL